MEEINLVDVPHSARLLKENVYNDFGATIHSFIMLKSSDLPNQNEITLGEAIDIIQSITSAKISICIFPTSSSLSLRQTPLLNIGFSTNT